jgi:hypothetical protein
MSHSPNPTTVHICYFSSRLSSHMAPWFTVTLQPAILSELLHSGGGRLCSRRIPKARAAIFSNSFIN